MLPFNINHHKNSCHIQPNASLRTGVEFLCWAYLLLKTFKPFSENILQALHGDQSILGELINLFYVWKPLNSTLNCTIKGMSYVPRELFQYPSLNYRIVYAKQNCWSMDELESNIEGLSSIDHRRFTIAWTLPMCGVSPVKNPTK